MRSRMHCFVRRCLESVGAAIRMVRPYQQWLCQAQPQQREQQKKDCGHRLKLWGQMQKQGEVWNRLKTLASGEKYVQVHHALYNCTARRPGSGPGWKGKRAQVWWVIYAQMVQQVQTVHGTCRLSEVDIHHTRLAFSLRLVYTRPS